MDCCKNDLGIFPHNEDINLGPIAEESGEVTLFFTGINGTKFSIKINVADPTADADIIIPKGLLNEDLYYCFTIRNPSGSYIEKITDGIGCGNYCLKTFIDITSGCGDTCPSEPSPV